MIKQEHLNIYLKTTDTCNLNCSHCYTGGNQNSKAFFDPQTTKTFLNNIKKENPDLKELELSFHGGEPMLAPLKDMWEIYYYAKDLFDNVTFRVQTNLMYELTPEKIEFLMEVCDKEFGTSWDLMRFTKEGDQEKWIKNVKILVKAGAIMTSIVSISKELIEDCEPLHLETWMEELGFAYILYERLTPTGHALTNEWLIPRNKDIDEFYMNMYLGRIKDLLEEKPLRIRNISLSAILSSVIYNVKAGCSGRKCTQHIVTLNANGTVGGCPNSAPYRTFGDSTESLKDLANSEARSKEMAKESIRNSECYSCDIFDICNGDCFQLKWDDTGCASPRTLMRHLKEVKDYSLSKRLLEEW